MFFIIMMIINNNDNSNNNDNNIHDNNIHDNNSNMTVLTNLGSHHSKGKQNAQKCSRLSCPIRCLVCDGVSL